VKNDSQSFTPRIEGDDWEGLTDRDWSIDNPTDVDLDHAVDRLDAQRYTLLTVCGEGESHLMVGGGGGQYIVYVTFDNWDFWNLLRSTPATGKVMLNAGGQEGDYPARQIVTKEQAVGAARFFLRERCLDPNQTWEKQSSEGVNAR